MPEKIELSELLAEIEIHRKRASDARRLATAISDKAAQESLRGYAEEIDRRVKEFEALLVPTKQPPRRPKQSR